MLTYVTNDAYRGSVSLYEENCRGGTEVSMEIICDVEEIVWKCAYFVAVVERVDLKKKRAKEKMEKERREGLHALLLKSSLSTY